MRLLIDLTQFKRKIKMKKLLNMLTFVVLLMALPVCSIAFCYYMGTNNHAMAIGIALLGFGNMGLLFHLGDGYDE
jgi:hypothetical protein